MRLISKKSRNKKKVKKDRWNWDTQSKAVMGPMTERKTFKEFIKEMEDDMPTGEYQVCGRCKGKGCVECEEGLRDVTKNEDWHHDIDEHGQAIGVCPLCGGEARYEASGTSLRDAEAHWECTECGHEGERTGY